MPFDIRQLRYAVVAADERSFAKAAKILHIKQSTLSKRILAMEERMGITLFERSTRGAVPTRAGSSFIQSAKRIVEEIDRLGAGARAIGMGKAGAIALGFSTSLSAGNLRSTVLDFRHRYPEVELSGHEAGWDDLARGLRSRAIDVAIIPGQLTGEGFEKRHLWPERLMVALPEAHPLAFSERIFWSDLRSETFVLPRRDPGPDAGDLVRARLRDIGTKANIVMQDVTRENILNMVSAGRYVSLVAETAAGVFHPEVQLREIHDIAGLAHVDFWAWWCRDNDNPALRQFFRLIGERYPAFSAT